MSAAQVHQQNVTEELNAEREKRQRLEDTVEAIAKQHNALERAVIKRVDKHRTSSSPNSDISNGLASIDGIESGQRHHDTASAKSSMLSDYEDEVGISLIFINPLHAYPMLLSLSFPDFKIARLSGLSLAIML